MDCANSLGGGRYLAAIRTGAARGIPAAVERNLHYQSYDLSTGVREQIRRLRLHPLRDILHVVAPLCQALP